MDFESFHRPIPENLPKSWFEFLLSPELLTQHLRQPNPDPSPYDLIEEFLKNAFQKDLEVQSKGEEAGDASKKEPIGDDAPSVKKSEALRLLAVKVASYLEWDLGKLMDRLSLPIQQSLLEDLVSFTTGQAFVSINHSEISLNSYSAHECCALSLYHRWCLMALRRSSYPARPMRPSAIQGPGQNNSQNYSGILSQEQVLQLLDQMEPLSLEILQQMAGQDLPISLPVPECFNMLHPDRPSAEHDWSKAIPIPLTEAHCQLSYDLGIHFFFVERFAEAKSAFRLCLDKRAQISSPSKYVHIDEKILEGHCMALEIPHVASNDAKTPKSSLRTRLWDALNQRDEQGLLETLNEDNRLQELRSETREQLEDIMRVTWSPESILSVQVSNSIRRALDSHLSTKRFDLVVKGRERASAESLIKGVKTVLPAISQEHRLRLKHFLQFLFISSSKEFIRELSAATQTSFPILSLVGEDVVKRADAQWAPEPQLIATGWDDTKDFTGGIYELEVSESIQTLIASYDNTVIRDLILHIGNADPKSAVRNVNGQWEVPPAIQSCLDSMGLGFLPDFIFIMVAKARELVLLKSYGEAKSLLDIVLQEVRNIGPKMGFKLRQLISWERLLVDITAYNTAFPNNSGTALKETLEGARGCLTTATRGGDAVLPRPELVEHCCAFLLNQADWGFLAAMKANWSMLELSAALAAVCFEVADSRHEMDSRHQRISSYCLWDLILPLFCIIQPRRGMEAAATAASLSRAALQVFISHLHHHLVIGLLISCLTRLFNILKDEPSLEVTLEYAQIWPNVVSNPNGYCLDSVTENLRLVLDRALSLYPSHIPWLHAKASFHYALYQYVPCLRTYLLIAEVASEYFVKPIPKNILDDSTLKRMINSCSQLQYFTQAAVLCQFFDDVDYKRAFQCLSEKYCVDAGDEYYDYIWDITILEFLIHLHHKKGEWQKKQKVLKLMGRLDLNSNNPDEIRKEAENLRRAKFLRALSAHLT